MEKIVFSEEEKNEYKKIIFDKLLDGISYTKIANYVGIDRWTVKKYTEEMVKERKDYF